MLKITRFMMENRRGGCVTDAAYPRFSFALESDRENVTLKQAVLEVGDWRCTTDRQLGIRYEGPALRPFTMISYNHYASGAVGDFLYRRVAGIEPIDPGYKTFRVQPVLGGDLTAAKAKVVTPYGPAASEWSLKSGQLELHVEVPVNTRCQVVLPDGRTETVGSGSYTFRGKA